MRNEVSANCSHGGETGTDGSVLEEVKKKVFYPASSRSQPLDRWIDCRPVTNSCPKQKVREVVRKRVMASCATDEERGMGGGVVVLRTVG